MRHLSGLLRRRQHQQQQQPAQWFGDLLLVLLLTTTALPDGTLWTDAFTIRTDTYTTISKSSRFVKAKSQSQRYLWPRTTKEKENSQVQQQPLPQPKEELHEQQQQQSQQQPGIQALQRLLTRQEAEVEDTKRLLQLIQLQQQHAADQSNGNTATSFATATTRTSTTTTSSEPSPVSLLSMATSVMRGFDYGFVSRSEGPKLVLSNHPELLQRPTATTTTASSSVEVAGYGPPENIWSLGTKQFMRNLQAMFNEYRDEQEIGTFPQSAYIVVVVVVLHSFHTLFFDR
jgi:hypothetical protein